MPYHDPENLAIPRANGLPIGLNCWLVCSHHTNQHLHGLPIFLLNRDRTTKLAVSTRTFHHLSKEALPLAVIHCMHFDTDADLAHQPLHRFRFSLSSVAYKSYASAIAHTGPISQVSRDKARNCHTSATVSLGSKYSVVKVPSTSVYSLTPTPTQTEQHPPASYLTLTRTVYPTSPRHLPDLPTQQPHSELLKAMIDL